MSIKIGLTALFISSVLSTGVVSLFAVAQSSSTQAPLRTPFSASNYRQLTHRNSSPPHPYSQQQQHVRPPQQQQQQKQLLQPYFQASLYLQRSIWDFTNPYTKSMHDILSDLHNSMLIKSNKFDDQFTKLLTLSKRDLHRLFSNTYGMLYEQNAEIFTEMFENLEQYYSGGRIKLGLAIESFFARLYQKMFQALNTQYYFDESYLKCATEQIAPLKPFGDIPDKLNKEIKESFIAARTLSQAIRAGIDFIKNIMSLGPPADFLSLIKAKLLNPTKPASSTLTAAVMPYYSQSARQSVPCQSYCELVITRGIGKNNLDLVHEAWNKYVTILVELAAKLKNKYNIATAIEPLDVQISEAIMNMQDNGENITGKVFQACGRPQLPSSSPTNSLSRYGRTDRTLLVPPKVAAGAVVVPADDSAAISTRRSRREVLTSVYDQQPARVITVNNRPVLNSRVSIESHLLAAESTLTSDTQKLLDELTAIIEDVRVYMNIMKPFWGNLPNAVCTYKTTNGQQALSAPSFLRVKQQPHQQQASCFEDKLSANDNNIEIRYRYDMDNLAHSLRSMSDKMRLALNGHEIDWSFDSPSTPGNSVNPLPTVQPSITIATTAAIPDDPDEDGDDLLPEDPGSGKLGEEYLEEVEPEEEEIDEEHTTNSEETEKPNLAKDLFDPELPPKTNDIQNELEDLKPGEQLPRNPGSSASASLAPAPFLLLSTLMSLTSVVVIGPSHRFNFKIN